MPATSGHILPRQWPGGIDQQVLRTQRVRAAGHLPEEVVGDESPAPHVPSEPGLIQVLFCDCARGEVHTQAFAPMPKWHRSTSFL